MGSGVRCFRGLIQKLTTARDLEVLKNPKLAHLKRIRFGVKSEALITEQKSLFEDGTDQDFAAIVAARQQVTLARSTLSEWIGRIGVALQPLADRLAELLRQSLHAEETPVQQLDPGKGKTRALISGPIGVMIWMAVHRLPSSTTKPVEAANRPPAFLEGWQGILMVDDYRGYKAPFATGLVGHTRAGSSLIWIAARRRGIP